ncbi:unnamed protein product [Caenorhabditis auriculariae]|uniref:Coiled-coil domain-containing protein 51 n=1 Tax=Caenorhabditis auriculariae TaxID=2777116 RepID=A0A8S1H703_9PELO|nr:unnamed protein product [Caenorhabditis auriculariae]
MQRLLFNHCVRCCNISQLHVSTASQVTANQSGTRATVEKWVDAYEEFIGVKAVKLAQDEVMKWEGKLSQAQMIRREKQAEINTIQSRLKEIHFDLDRTSRGEDKYLELLTEEHAIIKKGMETAEREAFHQLSNRVRASHERERERAEKTKWWSVSASLTGALLGIIGTSLGNELRMRKLREMLPIGGAHMSEMAKSINEQNEKITHFIKEIRSTLNLAGGAEASANTIPTEGSADEVVAVIREENARMAKEMKELLRLTKLEAALDADPQSVVYVGSEMERLLDQTEKKIESKMKLQTLLTVVFLYTAAAVTAPWLYAIFKRD